MSAREVRAPRYDDVPKTRRAMATAPDCATRVRVRVRVRATIATTMAETEKFNWYAMS